jgi:branched-chain amino acid transport system permease protein
MDRFLTLTLNGVSSGAVYAALALSLVIIYRATRVVNFAQPALALISAFLAYTVTQATGSYWLGFGVALTSGLLMGAVVERTLIRPVRNRPQISAIIVTLGLLMVLQAVAGMIWSNEPHAFPYAFDFRGRFSAADLFAVASVAVTALLLLVLFKATPIGLRMRAAAFQPEIARLVGVRVGLMLTLGWALAALVGSLAGMLAAPPFIFPNVLDGVFVFGFTAAVIGGLDSPFGTIVGGLVLGVGLSYVSGYVGPELVTLAALAILVIVLTFRPTGLFSRTTLRQV